MKRYDVVVVGGGIAGSVAARYTSAGGLKTLLVEKHKTPRNKPCTGLQFEYFEKLIGVRIPPSRLCSNELYKMEIILPSGMVFPTRMKMLNFWRTKFDAWLNLVALSTGAEFRDETHLVDFDQKGHLTIIKVRSGTHEEWIETRYLVAADGINSTIRKKIAPKDFVEKASRGTQTCYFEGQADFDPNTCYMFYNCEFNPLAFGVVYLKDDLWMITTGADQNLKEYMERFYQHVFHKYNLKGKVVRKEGFAFQLKGGIFLGQGNLLMVGDAAGLLDMNRVLGMDNAAISGRHAASAILEAEENGLPALINYKRQMSEHVEQIENGIKKMAATNRYRSNKELESSLMSPEYIKSGILMLAANLVNKFLPPEEIITLPLAE